MVRAENRNILSSSTFKEVVVLDLDGVIADTFSFHIDGWKQLVQHFGGELGCIDFEQFKGVPTALAIKQLFEAAGMALGQSEMQAAIEMKNRVRDERIEELGPELINPVARTVIENAKNRGSMVVCFATTSATEVILDNLGVRHAIDWIIEGSSWTRKKCHYVGELVEKLCLRYDVEASDIGAIDDSREVCKEFRKTGVDAIWFHKNFTQSMFEGTWVSSLID